jgi:hypothetical protein
MRPDKARMITQLKALVKELESPTFDIGFYSREHHHHNEKEEFHGNIGDDKLFSIKLITRISK